MVLCHICAGCGNITDRRKYCSACERKRTARRWAVFQKERQEQGQNIYHSKGWQVLRQTVLERDRWLCLECLRNGIYTSATEVDHIIPRSQGGSDDLSNLQSLCHECHKRKTYSESAGKRYQ
jgi:5-methylcytosine-specific restriction protein A